MSVPENFDLLHTGEADIRRRSLAAIDASEDLSMHARMIEISMTVLTDFAQHHPHAEEDELVMQMLASRLFNSSAAALGLTLRGYYQGAVALMRDILETTFLMDYFWTWPEMVARWRGCDEKQRISEFPAAKTRIALDDRDGFTERGREQHYKLLCELGSHPSYRGFQMMISRPGNLVTVGPFFSEPMLGPVLYELAKVLVHAGSHIRLEERSIADYRLRLAFMDTQADWSDKFFRTKMDRSQIAEMRAVVDELERKGWKAP